MNLILNEKKKNKIKAWSSSILNNPNVGLRDLASLIGNVVASFPAVTHGPLHYRHLEKNKTAGLKYHKGYFD